MTALRGIGLRVATGLVVLAAATPSVAQQRAAIGVVGYFVEQGSPSENASQSGTWVGVEGRIPAGRFIFAGRYVAGPLEGNPARVDRAARETQLTIGYRAGRWLTVGAQGKATVIESDLSNSVARMYGVAAALGSGLGVTGLHARAEVAIYPLTSVVAAQELGLPRQVEVGVAYRSSRLPAEVYLSYLMENIDFKNAADLRLGGPLLSIRLGR